MSSTPPSRRSAIPSAPAVTWSLLAAVVTTGVIVLGGVMKVDAMFDEKFREMRNDMVAADNAAAASMREHVSEVYARKDQVARDPVEGSEMRHLKEAVASNGDKLDKLRTLILKRR